MEVHEIRAAELLLAVDSTAREVVHAKDACNDN